MLKKVKVGLVGVALIMILMFVVATFNVGSVNASPTDKISSSDLKFVTKYVPEYGNVTAREDMFVGDGDNIKVVLNKDYKEIGAITPIFEKLPVVDFITVDTPYGKVNVTQDTYNTLGKDKIIANQKEFIEQRNELIKMGLINTTSNNYDITNEQLTDLAISQVQADVTNILQSVQTTGFKREDWMFSVKPGYSPNYIYGQLSMVNDPSVPDGVTSYHELEITLNSPGEVLEFIAHHHGTQRDVWACMFDDHHPSGVVYHAFYDVHNPIEFYFNYNTQYNHIDIVFYNPATRVTVPFEFTDSTLGTAITWMDGSSELTYPEPIPTFRTDSNIEQWMTRSGSTFYNPTDVFNSLGHPKDGQGHPIDNIYVSVGAMTLYGHYIAPHACGSMVA